MTSTSEAMNGDTKSAVEQIHKNGVNGTSTSKGTNGDDAAYVPEVVKPAPQVQAQPTLAETSFEVSLNSLHIVSIDPWVLTRPYVFDVWYDRLLKGKTD
jgi:hypothetical protein